MNTTRPPQKHKVTFESSAGSRTFVMGAAEMHSLGIAIQADAEPGTSGETSHLLDRYYKDKHRRSYSIQGMVD
jgi:hypothetical protein